MQYTPTTGTYAPASGVMTLTLPTAQYTPVDGTTYNPSTGQMTLAFATAHGLAVGEEISFANNSLTFTCAKDDFLTIIHTQELQIQHTEKNVKLLLKQIKQLL